MFPPELPIAHRTQVVIHLHNQCQVYIQHTDGWQRKGNTNIRLHHKPAPSKSLEINWKDEHHPPKICSLMFWWCGGECCWTCQSKTSQWPFMSCLYPLCFDIGFFFNLSSSCNNMLQLNDQTKVFVYGNLAPKSILCASVCLLVHTYISKVLCSSWDSGYQLWETWKQRKT